MTRSQPARPGPRPWWTPLLLVLMVWVGSTAPLQAGRTPPPPPGPPVVLCLGDELTAGYGVGLTSHYPALLQELIQQRGYPHRVINQGIAWGTSAEAVNRLPSLLAYRPAVVVVALGSNDIRSGQSLTDLKRNLERIIGAFQKQGSRVLLAGVDPPPWHRGRLGGSVPRAYRQVAEKSQVPLAPDLLEGIVDDPELTLTDRFHPNMAGYRRVVNHLWYLLQPLLDATTP